MSTDLIQSQSNTAATDDELKLELVAYFAGFTSFRPAPGDAFANVMAYLELLRGMSRQTVRQGRLSAVRKGGDWPMSAGDFWKSCAQFHEAQRIRNEPRIVPPALQHVEISAEEDRRVHAGFKCLVAELAEKSENSAVRKLASNGDDEKSKREREKAADKALNEIYTRRNEPLTVSAGFLEHVTGRRFGEAAE